MRLNVQFRAADALRTVEIVFRQAKDVQPVLRRWGGWLRKDAQRHFEEQPGWPGLADSTRARLEQTRTSAITARGTVRRSYEKRAAVQLAAQLRKGVVNADTKLAELRRLARGGSTRYTLQSGTRRYDRAIDRLRSQLDKARAGRRVGGDRRASERHALLGRLRGSITAVVRGAAVVVESRVPWSKIHNQGGTAGHGSRIPARTFLEITQEAARALADIALEHFLGKDR